MANPTTQIEKKEPFLLKNIFSPSFVEQVAAEVKMVQLDFQSTDFQKLVIGNNWESLELKQRMRHISNCLRRCLPERYDAALGVLVKVAENLLERNGERMAFEWMILPDFVEAHGVDDPGLSLSALETMTRLASAEFAIRPFLLKHQDQSFSQMHRWSEHESPMVRRLSSEGFRPRLPWGMGVPTLKTDPNPILPVLEKLKNDPSETVRRSVANNLNDISKDHPALALDIAERWLSHSAETDWVVRHACRGLLKKGNARALSLFGYEKGLQGIEIQALKVSPKTTIGGSLDLSFLVKNIGKKACNLRLEYAIHYLTSTGNISRKVFKIKELELQSGHLQPIAKRQSFKDFTTRKHYSGKHKIEVVVNGEVMAEAEFQVM